MAGRYNVVQIANFTKDLKALSKKYPSIKNDVENLAEELAYDPFKGESLGGRFL